MSIEDLLYPLLASYINSPQWIKNSVGRAYSWIPRRIRTGRNSDRFFKESGLQNEENARRFCTEKLAATLQCALQSVPAYRPYRHLLTRLEQPREVLRELPLVSKTDIKRDLARFLSTTAPASLRLQTFTGGSISTPMMFYLHKGVSRTKEYRYITNFHSRAGLSKSDIVLALRGRPVATAKRPGGRLWMYEPIKRELILSSEHLEHAYMPEYIKALRTWKPTYIQAYPSTIYPLARWLRENPAPDVSGRIKGIMLFSENVLAHHLALLRETFTCPILLHYGQSERVVMAASMPDDDRYFFWPQSRYVELIDAAGKPVTQAGHLGEIVGTGFDNRVMPFVRYRTGDMAILGDQPHPLLPGYVVIERIEGRRQEFVVCHDHRLISLSSMTVGLANSGALADIYNMQYEQNRPGHFLVRVVAAKKLSAEARAQILTNIRNNTQDGCSAELIDVAEIPRTVRGKQQVLIQKLDISQFIR
jgi:phenylacetate-CoA ligase